MRNSDRPTNQELHSGEAAARRPEDLAGMPEESRPQENSEAKFSRGCWSEVAIVVGPPWYQLRCGGLHRPTLPGLNSEPFVVVPGTLRGGHE